jgi:hypothetical protein
MQVGDPNATTDELAPSKDKVSKVKDAKGYKTKLKRHKDAVLCLHSVDGIEGEFIMSGSADHSVRCMYKILNIQILMAVLFFKIAVTYC